MRRVGLLGLIVAALLAARVASAAAQTATGQITGSVQDPSGAVMRKVKVTVTNQETGLTRDDDDERPGRLRRPLLPVGHYLVTAEETGFKTALRSDVTLNVDQIQRVDLQLEAGNLSETVEVKAARHRARQRQRQRRPDHHREAGHRTAAQRPELPAAAVPRRGRRRRRRASRAAMRQGAGNAISIMGSRPTSNNFMIDGTSNVDTALGTPAAILSVDAIQEFKEQTTTYSAEYGFSANQINLVSKSGTNTFHGTVFGFMRNEAFDARNFFDSPTRTSRKLDQKQFGGVVGGPIVASNKTFFLFNYEGTRIKRGSSTFSTVPTPDKLAGRFTTTIIDPLTGQPFPNNTIPAVALLTPRAARAAEQLVPGAEHAARRRATISSVRTLPQDQDQFTDPRSTRTLGTLRAGVRPLHEDELREHGQLAACIEIGDSVFVQDTKNWQVSHSWPIEATSSTSSASVASRRAADQHGIACPQSDVDFLGLTGVFTNMPDAQRECPAIGMQGYAGTGGASTPTRRATSRCGTSATRPPGSRDPHPELRLQLPALAAAARPRHRLPRQLRLQRRLHRRRVADMLLGYYSGVGVVPARGLQRPRAARQPARVQLHVFRAVHPGRLESQLAS